MRAAEGLMSSPSEPRLIGTKDIAREYDIPEWEARRLMKKWHKEHGPGVVAKKGREWVTTPEALATAFPGRPLTDTQARILAAERRAEAAEAKCSEVCAIALRLQENQRGFRAEMRALVDRVRELENVNLRNRGRDER